MISFEILKKSKKSRARLGILKTPHGEVETPAFVPVATQAVVKTLTSEEAAAAGSQLLICNTFHLHLKPGEKIVQKAGGLHDFMNWKRPLMTDSGGFQVFSLGFGREYEGVKINKRQDNELRDAIKAHHQPKFAKITDDGVVFRSPIDGCELFIGPKESIKIQEKLGADIIFAFDECTSPYANYEYVKRAMLRTHEWAEKCVKTKKSGQAMFGIIQGSRFKDLREASAACINAHKFDGFGIGGDLGDLGRDMKKIIGWVTPFLEERKPRHLLGIGYLEDLERVVESGIDTFDCIVPTHYARRGIAFTSHGKLDLRKGKFLTDKKPLDKNCDCFVCRNYRRNYIAHLWRAKEITPMKLLTFHNLHYFNNYVAKIREKIKKGLI